MHDWVSILPPLAAIVIAVWKKEVILALGFGIWLGEVLLIAGGDAWSWPEAVWLWPLAPLELAGLGVLATLDRCVGVFADGGAARVLLFGLLVGALLELMQESGGVAAFVRRAVKGGLARSARGVSALPAVIGTAIFVETSMSILSSGVVAQKLFDQFKLSRERLAFLVDSTCAPISVLVLFNGWGAYVLGLLEPYGFERPAMVLAGTIPLNFYAIVVLAMVWYTVFTTRTHGAMRRVELTQAEAETTADIEDDETPTKTRYMLAPLMVLVVGMIFFMWHTGDGKILDGSGSRSVLYAVCAAILLIMALLAYDRVFSYGQMVEISFRGVAKLAPVVTIMLLSFAIGAVCKDLGTGPFIAQLVGPFLPVVLAAPLLFLSAAAMSFTTGTSWGTFAILVPVAIPLASSMGLPPAFALSAVLGGGVFGDHCSPISDTTVLSSLASGCHHLDHVRTQLPYALTAGGVAMALYLTAGAFL